MIDHILNFKTVKKGNLFFPESELKLSKTSVSFGKKWENVNNIEEKEFEKYDKFQKEWFLKLYGFKNENELKIYLNKNKIIIDAGCGLGHKTKWFSELSPQSIVIGVDISSSIYLASERYKNPRLFFVKGDISLPIFKKDQIDLVICDQVIMHTKKPEDTFKRLSNSIKNNGKFFCYVYKKKALPRELIDDYFRENSKNYSEKELWEFSSQISNLGKKLDEIDLEIDFPEVKLLDIKAGKYSIQRFIYWNFLKIFYNRDFSKEMNDSVNFDWYAPEQAKRFTKKEYMNLIEENSLHIDYFNQEEACFSSRMTKTKKA